MILTLVLHILSNILNSRLSLWDVQNVNREKRFAHWVTRQW